MPLVSGYSQSSISENIRREIKANYPKWVYAYVAGIVDGEGHIDAITFPYSKSFYARVQVVNTNKDVLLFLQEFFGGDIREVKSTRRGHPNWKSVYCWRLSYQKAANLLEKLIPFLIIKQDQALWALTLHAAKDVARKECRGKDGRISFSQEWVDCFASIAEEIKHLNKRGVENAS